MTDSGPILRIAPCKLAHLFTILRMLRICCSISLLVRHPGRVDTNQDAPHTGSAPVQETPTSRAHRFWCLQEAQRRGTRKAASRPRSVVALSDIQPSRRAGLWTGAPSLLEQSSTPGQLRGTFHASAGQAPSNADVGDIRAELHRSRPASSSADRHVPDTHPRRQRRRGGMERKAFADAPSDRVRATAKLPCRCTIRLLVNLSDAVDSRAE